MTRARWIGLAIVALVVEATLVRLGVVTDPIPKLAGSAAWTTSRAAGVTAFAALTLDVVFGLFVSTGADRSLGAARCERRRPQVVVERRAHTGRRALARAAGRSGGPLRRARRARARHVARTAPARSRSACFAMYGALVVHLELRLAQADRRPRMARAALHGVPRVCRRDRTRHARRERRRASRDARAVRGLRRRRDGSRRRSGSPRLRGWARARTSTRSPVRRNRSASNGTPGIGKRDRRRTPEVRGITRQWFSRRRPIARRRVTT